MLANIDSEETLMDETYLVVVVHFGDLAYFELIVAKTANLDLIGMDADSKAVWISVELVLCHVTRSVKENPLEIDKLRDCFS